MEQSEYDTLFKVIAKSGLVALWPYINKFGN